MNPNDTTAKYYDVVYSHVKGQDVIDAEIDLIQSIVQPGKPVLDLACGTGRHAIPLAQMGYEVAGIDSSERMISILNSKFQILSSKQNFRISNSKSQSLITQNPKLITINDDFFNHDFGSQRFDLIIMMWNAFNEICLTEDDAERLFNKIIGVGTDHDQRLLMEHGKILINIDDSEFIDPPNLSHDLFVHEGDKTYESILQVESFNPSTNTTISKETINVFDQHKNLLESASALIEQRWWSVNQIKQMCKYVNMKMEVRKIPLNEELYLILT